MVVGVVLILLCYYSLLRMWISSGFLEAEEIIVCIIVQHISGSRMYSVIT